MQYIINEDVSTGEKIRRLRLIKGLTQKELARRVNLTQSAIYKLECGSSVQSRKIVAISKALGVSPEELDRYDFPKTNQIKRNTERFKLMMQQFPDWASIIPHPYANYH